MNTTQTRDHLSEIQAAIYGVALSLDSFVLNGITYGVLQRAIFAGFLEKTANNLSGEMAMLEDVAREIAASDERKAAAIVDELRAKGQELIDLVTTLTSFKSMPIQQLRLNLAQIPALRAECVRLLQDLEVRFQTSRPFYRSQANTAAPAMNDFLSNLERMFEDELSSSPVRAG